MGVLGGHQNMREAALGRLDAQTNCSHHTGFSSPCLWGGTKTWAKTSTCKANTSYMPPRDDVDIIGNPDMRNVESKKVVIIHEEMLSWYTMLLSQTFW